jgi:Undecaprenyl-phosphate glucose phosphotransferase
MLLMPIETGTAARQEAAFLSKYTALMDILLRVGDVLIVLVAAVLCYAWRFDSFALDRAYESLLLLTALLTMLIFPAFGLYRSWRGERVATEIGRATLAWLTVLAMLVLVDWALANGNQYSRLWLGSWAVSSIVLLTLHRWVARGLLGSIRMMGLDTRRVVVVGATPACRKIISAARSNRWMGLDVIGCVQTPYDDPKAEVGVPVLGDFEHFIASLRHSAPDQIWVALPLRAEAMIQRVLEATADIPATVRLVPDLLGYGLINQSMSSVAGVPVITLRGSRVEGPAMVAKAIEDRVLAAVILLLLAPLLALIALAVMYSSPGPVIYRQKRHGLAANEIEVWKFRSMRLHADQDGKVTQATANDSRVTRVGRFLRSSSLDELPQFFNVLQGRMSIVGPRPHAVEHNREYSMKLRGYMQRHGVKPGLTGMAQIRGLRGETDTLDKMARRVECDIEYIQNWSLWLDLKIIVLTPFALLKGTNAY